MEFKNGGKTNVGDHAAVYGKYDEKGNFTLTVGSATMTAFTVCRAYPLITTGIQTLNLILDPSKTLNREQKIEDSKIEYHKDFDPINISKSYHNLFELLWYTRLPCFDVKGITSKERDEMSVIKRCYWRGQMMDCAAIFITRSTDRGMCCTFNLGRAENIFKNTRYTRIMTDLQQKDQKLHFFNSKLLERYARRVMFV